MKKITVSLCPMLLVMLMFISKFFCIAVAEETSTQAVTEKSEEKSSQQAGEEIVTSATEITTDSVTKSNTEKTTKNVETKSTSASTAVSSSKSTASTSEKSKTTNAVTEANTETTSKSASLGGYTYIPGLSGVDATLASLVVKNFSISPAFSPNIVDYTLRVGESVKYITVSATPNEKNSDWRIAGLGKAENNEIKVELKTGKNIIKVICTSGEGYSKTYRITVTKEGKAEEKSTSYANENTSSTNDNLANRTDKRNIRLWIIIPLVIIEVVVVSVVLYFMLHKEKNITSNDEDKENDVN